MAAPGVDVYGRRLVFGRDIPCRVCSGTGTVPGELVGKPEPGKRRTRASGGPGRRTGVTRALGPV